MKNKLRRDIFVIIFLLLVACIALAVPLAFSNPRWLLAPALLVVFALVVAVLGIRRLRRFVVDMLCGTNFEGSKTQTAILTVLLSGKTGEAYNAANPKTYCSIVEMAQMVAHEIAHDSIKVHVPMIKLDADSKFSPPHHLNLDTSKIYKLGWRPSVGLREMYLRMMATM